MSDFGQLYEFVFRGLLAEEALDRAGRQRRVLSDYPDADIAKTLSIDRLDDDIVESARKMAVVYTAIAAFENSARKLVTMVLLQEVGDNWWEQCVSEKVRRRAERRRAEEENFRWHAQRGESPVYYTDLGDLGNIIVKNWDYFEPHVQSQEWVRSLFDVIERSRNVIMHSGVLQPKDIERVGMNIRDWIAQVGA